MIKEILKEAFVLKTNGYYKNAIECFYKALGQDSSSIEILYELAECYYLINEEERALSYLEQVLDRTSTHINSLNLLKKIFVDKKAWAEAEQAAKNIYCITQDLNDLAKILELLNKQGRYEEIFEYKTEGISSNILYEKAYAKYCTNDYNNAEIFINEALTSSKDEKLYLLKGKILYKTNRLEECIELLPHIEVNKNSDVLNYAGLIKQYECKFGEALELFLEAVRLSPKVSEYYYNCAST